MKLFQMFSYRVAGAGEVELIEVAKNGWGK